MSPRTRSIASAGGPGSADSELSARLKAHFQAENDVRRGVCLLNAGKYDEAALAFSRAAAQKGNSTPLASYMAACCIGRGETSAAVKHFSKAVEQDDKDVTARIRHGLALWTDGREEEAIEALRAAVALTPESAELHFQLGTLLANREQYEEAELRFTQARNLDRNHAQALMGLAMCCGLRNAPDEAVEHLQRAQVRRPEDATIGLMLAQAARAARQLGHAVGLRATMPKEGPEIDQRGIEELLAVIQNEPDFVEAFLSVPHDQIDPRVFSVLLSALQRALEHQPEHADLHYHCGQVLARLDRPLDAIEANERAVAIDPHHVRALIALAHLYRLMDRPGEAAERLEEVVAAGVEYADVFCLLGHLYRERGQYGRARSAYHRALCMNESYKDAREALAALPPDA
jgi:tetratricopeptide (TPR) repeat protein